MQMKSWITATAMLPMAASANPERWQLNMTEGITDVSREVYDVHMLMFWICVVIGVIVFGAMFYAMFKFRKSKGAVAAKFSHNTLAEVIWTVVPILILIGMAGPATKTLFRMYDSADAEMTVKITGYQWKWRYQILDYRGQEDLGINFISQLNRTHDSIRRTGSGMDPNAEVNYLLDVDKPLVLPTDTKIRFVLTADDVIHAWWVPALGWKQDAIPGFINEGWTRIEEPGVFRGQCAELCGKDHGFMPIVIDVRPRTEFEAWLAENKAKPKQEAAPAPAPAEPTPQEPADASPVAQSPAVSPTNS
jgi:cytochrome c oxidase subunit 2